MSARPGNRFLLAWVAVLFGLTAMTGGRLLAGTEVQSPLPVVYFYSPTCLQCQKARESIDAAERKYAGKIRVESHSIASADGLDLMFAYEEKYGAKEGAPPKVFVGKHHLDDAATILAQLDTVIHDELASRQPPAATPATKPAPATEPATVFDDPLAPPEPQYVVSALASPPPSQYMQVADSTPPVGVASTPLPLPTMPHNADPGARLEHRFQSFHVAAIVLAGLVDGVNPCAFTTIVFLLSAVAYFGKTKREIAVVGIAFTSAVFVTYLLLGMGFMLVVKTFAVQTGISLIITYAIAGLTFVLAGWSLFDGIRIARSGKVPRGTLGLPTPLKAVIRRVIKTGLKTRNLIVGSLVVGFLVSLLESFCTGQVYVPTIMIMLRAPGHSLSALTYLLIYNLMFILPLAIIMASAYFGVRSEWLGQVLKRHLAALKFALAGLFAGLGTILLLF